MKLISVLKHDVRLPSTPDDWELYSDSGAAAVTAAHELTTMLELEIQAWLAVSFGGHYAPTKLGIDASLRRLEHVMERHSAVGATDTEPRNAALTALSRAAAALGAVVDV